MLIQLFTKYAKLNICYVLTFLITVTQVSALYKLEAALVTSLEAARDFQMLQVNHVIRSINVVSFWHDI